MEKGASRSQNWTTKQTDTLIETYRENESTLKGNFRHHKITWQMKNECWQKIVDAVNSIGDGPYRTKEMCENKLRNMKKSTKSKFSRKNLKKTGGGSPPTKSKAEAVLQEMMKNSIKVQGIDGGMETIIDDDSEIENTQFVTPMEVREGESYNERPQTLVDPADMSYLLGPTNDLYNKGICGEILVEETPSDIMANYESQSLIQQSSAFRDMPVIMSDCELEVECTHEPLTDNQNVVNRTQPQAMSSGLSASTTVTYVSTHDQPALASDANVCLSEAQCILQTEISKQPMTKRSLNEIIKRKELDFFTKACIKEDKEIELLEIKMKYYNMKINQMMASCNEL